MSVRDSATDLVTDWAIRRDGPAPGPMSDMTVPFGGPARFYRTNDEPALLDDRKRMRQQSARGHADAAWDALDDELLHGESATVTPLIPKRLDPVLASTLGNYRPILDLLRIRPSWRPRAHRRESDIPPRVAEAVAAAQHRHQRVLALVTGPLRDVVDLHGPELDGGEVTCAGCDYRGCDPEPPEWPCTTFDLVERQVTS